MTAFEDFVNTELPLRVNTAVLPTANNYPRFTGVGRAVEERTPAQVASSIESDLSIAFSQITGVVDADTLDGIDSLGFALVGQLHAESHTVDSHSDTSATGAELNTLTDGSDAAALHVHEGTAVLSTGQGAGTKFLREDGDGTCSWQSAAGGGTPGGSDDQLQYNNSGAFGGISPFTWNGTALTIGTSTKLQFRDTGIYIQSDVDGDLKISADGDVNITGGASGQVNVGAAGDIDIFDSVAFRFGPKFTGKAHLGSDSLKWGTGFFNGLLDCSDSGVRGRYVAASITTPTPTDGELDSAFGQPSALGAGWTGVIEDTTGGARLLVTTDGSGWFVTGALVVVT